MMSSTTEQTTTKMIERQTETNRNSSNVKKMTTRRKENNKKKSIKKGIIELSSDSETEFSPKNTKSQSKTHTKQPKQKNIISSDDESLSDSKKKPKPNLRLKKAQKKQTVENSQKNNLQSKQNILTRADSTSSSEKEFSKHKIIESFVYLHRISDIEKDRTTAVKENKFDEDKHLTKNEAFLLKNNLQKLFQDLQKISTKLIYDIEQTRKIYYYKEQLRFSDATKAIIECKNILRNLKEKSNNCEKLLVDRYNGWCKKTNNVNIFINNDGPITPKRWKTPTINGTKKVVSSSSSNNDSEEELQKKKEKPTQNVEKSSANNGRKSPTEVSDCDGYEIFSADETEMEPDATNSDATMIDPKIRKSTGIKTTDITNEKDNRKNGNDSDDSDMTIFEKKVTTSFASGEQSVRKTTKTTQKIDLNQSEDLFTDTDEDDKENSIFNNSRNKTINHGSDFEGSVKNVKLSSDRNKENNKSSGTTATTSKNKLDSSSEEDDEKNNAEKKAKKKLLNSSSDSDRNEIDDEDANIKKKFLNSSSDSDKNGSKDEEANIKKKLLNSSADSDRNDVQNEENNKSSSTIATASKNKLDSSSEEEEEEEEEDNTEKETKKKLLNSSSDSDRNEIEDEDANIKKKLLNSSSDSDENDEQNEENNKSSSTIATANKNKLDSSSEEEEEEDNTEKETKKKLLNSSSDSDKNESKDEEANIKEKLLNSSSDSNDNYSKKDKAQSSLNLSINSNQKQTKNSTLKPSNSSSAIIEKPSINEEMNEQSMLITSESDTHTSDEDEVKKKLLDSSSDSDRNEEKNTENKKVQKKNNETDIPNVSDNIPEKETKKRISDIEVTKSNTRLSNKSMKISSFNESKQKNVEISDNETETDNSNTDNNKEHINNTREQEKELISNSSSENEDTAISKTSNNNKVKNKFTIKNNKYFKNDQKLRTKCFVKIQRLGENILSQHSHTLQSSREYLDAKQFHSLISLDQLEKKHNQGGNFLLNDDEDTAQLKIKKKQLNLTKETLLDHLDKVNSKEDKDQDSHSDNSDTEIASERMNNSSLSDNFMKESDVFAKAKLLDSSDSDVEIIPDKDSLDSSEDKLNKKKKSTEEKSSRTSNDEDETDEKSEKSEKEIDKQSGKTDKSDWKKNKVLTTKFFESDSEEENERAQKMLARKRSKRDDSDSDKSGGEIISQKKKTKRRRLVTSDDSDMNISSCSSDTDSDVKKKDHKRNKNDKKSTKRRKKSDSDSDAGKQVAVKTKRKRIRAVVDDSDSSDNEHDSSQTSANKGSGRKNIRKVLKDKQVAHDTQEAGKQEEERLKRMAERQKLFNEMYETRLANEEKVDKLILDFDEESKEILLDVDKNLVKRLKPHQAKGIKFMWDACFESLERIESNSGSGCILAHCMGLGKSFQVVTLAHTILTHNEKTSVNTVLIVAPLSTVLNWINEFKIWLAEVENGDDIELYEMTKAKTLMERKCQLENWQRTGGILIIGYEMFRNLCSIKGKVKKNVQEAIWKCILDPGPDLIICDEGHLLKNEDSAISKAIRKVRTLRRVVLTGTPLQNNLIEYHCMVQFVKPNLLGTKKEFLNRFVNPIQNGQFDDSTEYDVKIMKRRAHVLHKMLEGCVQRFDYSVLTPFLPPKQEYVILVKLTEVQYQMYQYYLDNLARKQVRVGGSLFVDFQGLHRIWTHPYVMKLHAENNERIMMKKREAASDSEGSLKDFINDDSDSNSSSGESNDSHKSDVITLDDDNKPVKRSTRANPIEEDPSPLSEEEPIEQREWWSQFVKPEHYTDVRVSAKLLLLLDILKEAEQIGDKVLVFSQSLYSLSLIEKVLEMIDDETQNSNKLPNLDKHTGSWSLGLDYFRFDGQTSAENRSNWVKNFNKPSNTRARLFLISTRAGGLGINLTAANRVVIFDASWNPSHDVQSIFRIYRFGQKKPCYVYRLLAAGTMEEKIYNRQVTKLSLSCRVVDEYQIERHYSNHDLAELYRLEQPISKPLALPKDRLLAEIFLRHKDVVHAYHEHDSLLENIAEEELNDEERKQAWQEYEEEKAGRRQMPPMPLNFNPQIMLYNNQMMDNANMNNIMSQGEHQKLLEMIKKDYPHISEIAQRELAYKALNNMYNYVENQFAIQAANNVNLPTMPVPTIPNKSTSTPSMTLANMLAQQEYARAHNKLNQQQKQMQYAQQFGNTVGNPQNKARPTTSTGKYSTNNGEIIDISSNNIGNLVQGNSEKRQEE